LGEAEGLDVSNQGSGVSDQRPENKGQGKSFFYAANIMHHFMGFRLQ